MSHESGDVANVTITYNPDPLTWPAWIAGHRFNASDVAYAFVTRPYSRRDRPQLTGVAELHTIPDGLRFTVRGLGAGYVERRAEGLLWGEDGACWDGMFFTESGLRRAYRGLTGRTLLPNGGQQAAAAVERATREAAVRAVLQVAAQPLTPTEIARALGRDCRWAWRPGLRRRKLKGVGAESICQPQANTKYIRDIALAIGATWLPGGKYVLTQEAQ